MCIKDCSLSLQKNQLSYVISASHVQKAAAFAMWPKPQNRQNNMIFDEHGLPYYIRLPIYLYLSLKY